MAGRGFAIPVVFLLVSFALTYSCCCGAEAPFDDEFNDEFDDEFEDENVLRTFDPLCPYNRFMFEVNDRLYFWVMKPIASGYGKIVPEGGRLAVNRFFKNIAFPVRFINNLLQLKIKNAAVEFARFGVNSTVGVLGFGDPATRYLSLKTCNEDFGQTLGRYGLGGGFHLVLPFLGPSNLRDAIGRIPDYFLSPIGYVEPVTASMAIRVYEQENYLSLHIGEYESLKKDALDPYTFMRDVYEQNRQKKVGE